MPARNPCSKLLTLNSKLQTRKSAAFTLIELLVVIAVLALLAAILFPVFARSREKARQTSCLSNVKQIGLGVSLYMQEWDDTYPIAAHKDEDKPHAWVEQFYSYVRTRNLNVCPSDSGFEEDPLHATSYFMNVYFNGGLSMADVPEPARTIYMAESAETRKGDHYHPNLGVVRMEEELARTRHGGGTNYLFADTHAKWMKFEPTLDPVNLHEISRERREEMSNPGGHG